MTFKLEIGAVLHREERSQNNRSGSDLVRQFRKQLRMESEQSQAKAEPKPLLKLVGSSKATGLKRFGR